MSPQPEQDAADLEESLLPQEGSEMDVASNDDGLVRERSDDDKDIVLDLSCCCWARQPRRTFRMNHNVFFNLLLSVLYGMSDSLWSGTVFAAYLKRLSKGYNTPVGDVEAINGLAMLFSALPVGYVADKFGRDKMCRVGGYLFLFTALMHAITMEWIGTDEEQISDHKRNLSIYLLGLVMALWGVGGGIVNGPCQALYADSTPAGDRSKYYHYLFVAYILSSCIGPIVSIILFQKLGDEWDLYQLRTIIYVGLAMESMNTILLMFFDDKKALDEESNDAASSADQSDAVEAVDSEAENQLTQPLLDEVTNDDSPSSPWTIRLRWLIPYATFFSSLVFAIGSGMTVKFFPLFFKDEVGMSPTQVQIIYVLVPIVMSAFSGVGLSLSPCLGRVQTTILLQASGVACLYLMVFFKTYLDAHSFVLVPIYILRTGLINSPYPLTESILMDYVPKDQRARWKSLESLASFGWCGSAAAGGYISDKFDYTRTFLITATIQVIGILTYATLLPLVPRKERDFTSPSTSNTPDGNSSNADESDIGDSEEVTTNT